MRATILTALVLLTACAAEGPGFSTTDALIVISKAPAGTVLTSATIKGDVFTEPNRTANLTVAAVDVAKTLVAAKVSGGSYSLALPVMSELENETGAVPLHERWHLVLFQDKNNNNQFDGGLEGAKATERDLALATTESYGLAYKGFQKAPAGYSFLPHNGFEKGWIVLLKTGYTPTQFHQDFTRKFNLTDSTWQYNEIFRRSAGTATP